MNGSMEKYSGVFGHCYENADDYEKFMWNSNIGTLNSQNTNRNHKILA